jgi:DNA-directed RNA polymerase specialized sigma24 family protein
LATCGNTVQITWTSVRSSERVGEGFPELFDEHHLPLFRFAYRLTGSVADAEDVVQE